jgi:co-chaperonin GroES (HSP10)
MEKIMLKGSGHYIVVELTDVAEKTAGGVLLPASHSTPFAEGVVVSAGTLVEADVTIGDHVVTMRNALSATLKSEGKDYYLVKDEHVLAVRR